MCHHWVLQFGKELTAGDVAGKRVLEVGSYDVNGSVRDNIERLGCFDYIGVDMREGPGVDEVCNASDLVERFGVESFDVVISTEMLEHVEDWRVAISNMKRVCKAGGLILITTRSHGYPRHEYPDDFWRFGVEDMRIIFADFFIRIVTMDPEAPGVFLLAQKKSDCQEVALSGIEVEGVK